MISATVKNDHYQTVVKSIDHQLTVDEPLDLGGKNTGFSPLDLLSGSLASCVAITLRMYADRKQWQIDEIRVEVDILELVIKKTIYISSNLDDSQLKRLSAISESCPISKMLSKVNTIETVVVNQK